MSINTATAAKKMDVDQLLHERRQLNALYKRVFSTPDGQKVLDDMRAQFYDRASVALKDGVVDPYRTHTNEGAREVALYILQRIKKGGENVGMDE